MNTEQKIKLACANAGISQAELARRINMTPSNFNQKLKRCTFTDDEMREIAKALGCVFRPCAFVFDNITIQ